MGKFLNEIRQRQEHLGYFVIWFFLWALAVALGKRLGWLAVIGLWVVFIVLLEMIYQWTASLRLRHAGTWWAKPRPRGYWVGLRFTVYLCVFLVGFAVRSPRIALGFLGLLAGGLLCADVIRLSRHKDEVGHR